jgi:hypothetical protein
MTGSKHKGYHADARYMATTEHINLYSHHPAEILGLCSASLCKGEEIRISRIGDSHDAEIIRLALVTDRNTRNYSPDTEKLSSGSAKCNIRAREVVHGRLRQHSIVFELRLAQWWAVTSNQNELG